MRKLIVLNSTGMLPSSVIPSDVARLTSAQQIVVNGGGHTAVLNSSKSAIVDPATGMDLILGQGVYVPLTSVGAANGIAPLGADSKISSSYLPGYLDNVVEVATYASLPVVGESNKIYVTLDTNKQYRWGGSVYIQLSVSPGTTDDLTQGSINKYFSESLVRSTVLTGLNVSATGYVADTDTIIVGLGKLQSQANNINTQAINHLLSTNNPHNVTAAQVGLGNVDNTSDLNKPISTATQTALNLKLNIANPTFTGTLTGPLISTDAIQFNTAYAGTTGVGKFSWNSTDGTMDLGLVGGNVVLQVGQEEVLPLGLNNTGSTLLNGYVARLSGSQGQRITIAYAQANNLTLSQNTIGLLTEDILNNQRGFVTCRGLVHGINTSAFAENDVLWLSHTTPGLLTNVEPPAPNISVRIGYCIKSHATDGHVYVSVQIGYNLDALNNVSFTSLVDGQVLSYNAASQVWVNTTLSKSSVGLGNVDNTSDANKPVSTATQTALNLKLNAAAPSYTGGLTGTGVVNLDTNQFYKDANGHIGLGVVPHTSWAAGTKVIDLQTRGSVGALVSGAVGDLFLASNTYSTGTDPGTATWNYRATGAAAKVELYNGAINVDTAVSGTADGAITWTRGLTVNSTGVGVRTSSLTEMFQVGDGTAGLTRFYARVFGSSTGADLYIGQSPGTIFGYTAGTIGVLYQNAAAPLGIVAAGAGQDLILGAGSSVTARVRISGTDGSLTINTAQASTSTSTGALVTVGGAGIGGALNVGGNTSIGGTLNVTGAVTLTSGLPITQVKDENGSFLYDDEVKNNLIDAPAWGTVADGWTNYGSVGTNSQVYDYMPNGEYAPIWQGANLVGSSLWFAGPLSKTIKIYNNKTYRICIPIRRVSANTDGHLLYTGVWAVSGGNVDNLNTSTVNGNAYFSQLQLSSMEQYTWYLLVAHVYPAGTTTMQNTGALYDMRTGQVFKNVSVSDFTFDSTSTTLRIRSGLYKASAATQSCTVQWGKPRIDVMDGSEGSLNDFFASTGLGNNLGLIGTNVLIQGNKLTKTGGAAATWDTGAYSKVGYTGGCYVRWRVNHISATSRWIVGLNTDASAGNGYTDIDYSLYNSVGNTLVAYESSVISGTLGTLVVGDILSIVYDGVNVKYYLNGTVVKTTAAVVTAALYLDVSLYDLGTVVSDLEFGPLVSTNWDSIGNKPTTALDAGLTDVILNNTNGVLSNANAGSASLTITNTNTGTAADSRIIFNNGTNTGGVILRGSGFTGAANNTVMYSSAGIIEMSVAGTTRMTISSTNINIVNSTGSTSSGTGALTVAGGAGIAGNLFVGGAVGVTGALDVTGTITGVGGIALTTTAATYRDIRLTRTDHTVAGFAASTNSANMAIFSTGQGTRAGLGQILIQTEGVTRITVSNVGDTTISSTTASTSTTTGSLVVGGGAGFAGAVYAASFNGSGAGLTSLTGANVTGTVPLATSAGTVSTAAQPNITSLGTLTGLTSSGVVNITNATASTSTTTGALTVTGGAGFGGSIIPANGLATTNTTMINVVSPAGGKYYQATADVRGAILVTLPVTWTSNMLTVTIRAYSYVANTSFEVVCSGYNFAGTTQWFNTAARIVGDPHTPTNYNVRFGHDGTKCCIVIGDENATTGTLWAYPQFEILEVSIAHNSPSVSTWSSGWAIGLVNDVSTYTFTSTITNSQVGMFLTSLGSNIAAPTGRSYNGQGVFTYNTLSASLGDSTPSAYWSTLGFGRGQGAAELAAAWSGGNNSIWYRTIRDVADNWTVWKEILTSASFNTYAPTLTGTGASGSWGISVTGSAATVTGAAQSAITSLGTLTGLTSSGVVTITNATASTSTSTGALITTGGAGFGGAVYAASFNGSGAGLTSIPFSSITGTVTAFNATRVTVTDSRAVVDTPETTASPGVYADFKSNATNSLTDGGSFNGVITMRQYGSGTDWTGGKAHQLAFTNNDNIWHRSGSSTTWGTWYKLIHTNNTSSITSVGTLTSLTSSGTITAPTAVIGNRSSIDSAPGDLFSLPKKEAELSFVGATYEITQVTCVADVAGSLAGKYFRVYGPAGTATAIDPVGAAQIIDIWFQVSGSGTQPVSGAGRWVQVTITTGATAIQVAAAVQTALATDAGLSAAADGAGVVFITAKTPENFTDSSAGTSGFTVSTIAQGSGALTGSTLYAGSVLAPNGKIYFIPYGATTVLALDPSTGITNTFGSVTGSGKYVGAALAPNGKIYCAPAAATAVLEIDTNTETVSTFGTLAATASKYYGACLAPNGKIYCAPFAATSILEIDPNARTIDTFGSLTACAGIALGLNSKLYIASSSNVYVLYPNTKTIKTITATLGGSGAVSLVTAPNGKIYGVPFQATSVYVIDPDTDTISTMAGTFSGTNKWWGGVLAPNGKIYCIPRSSAHVLVIDPAAGTAAVTFLNGFSTTDKYLGGCLAPNGNIYMSPYNARSIGCIGGGTSVFPHWYLSAYFNKT